MSAASVPLCVDLDGTLLKTDTTWERVLLYLKSHPLHIFSLIGSIVKGKVALKNLLQEHTMLDEASLPYRTELVTFLETEKKRGRKIVLVTGTHLSTAKAIAGHANLFNDVLGTDEKNLTGKNKAEKLVELFGDKGFDYMGNAHADIAVWKHARKAYVVGASGSVKRRLKHDDANLQFADRSATFPAFFKSIRPHQWVKNLLIFVPIVTSHTTEIVAIERASLAFIAFCLCTSSVYIINDLFDLSADRVHARKKFRPIAAGDLPIQVALPLAPIGAFVGLLLANALSVSFLLTLCIYFIVTLSYSLYLKQVALIDVLLLAGLYTIRIIAGHTVTDIPYSPWLLLFAMFFFFSLALIKRYTELQSIAGSKVSIAGRGYSAEDKEIVSMLGIGSAFVALLILALYIASDSVLPLYGRPFILWLVVPVMMYWICRMWVLAHRGAVHDDPVFFALKDRVSYAIGALLFVLLILAS